MEIKKKTLWPCVECTEQEYKDIREQLIELGYSDSDEYFISDWSKYPILGTKYINDPKCIGNSYIIDPICQYLCGSIHEFLEATKAIAIERGWFKESEDKKTSSPNRAKIKFNMDD